MRETPEGGERVLSRKRRVSHKQGVSKTCGYRRFQCGQGHEKCMKSAFKGDKGRPHGVSHAGKVSKSRPM